MRLREAAQPAATRPARPQGNVPQTWALTCDVAPSADSSRQVTPSPTVNGMPKNRYRAAGASMVTSDIGSTRVSSPMYSPGIPAILSRIRRRRVEGVQVPQLVVVDGQ